MYGTLKLHNVIRASRPRSFYFSRRPQPLCSSLSDQHAKLNNGTSSACISSSAPRTSVPVSHSSLESFLAHAKSTALSRSSTVFAGTLYEYQCLSALSRLGLQLERVGGAGDAGVDLRGTWSLPSLPQKDPFLPVIVQCKALSKKAGPVLVRELEGALAGAARTEGNGTVGVLCAIKSATKGVRDTLKNSSRPMVWLQVAQVLQETEGVVEINGTNDAAKIRPVRIRQMLWNEAFEETGARGMSVGLARVTKTMEGSLDSHPTTSGEQNKKSTAEDDDDAEIVLLTGGEIWKP